MDFLDEMSWFKSMRPDQRQMQEAQVEYRERVLLRLSL